MIFLKSCCNSEMTSNIAACSSFIPNLLDKGALNSVICLLVRRYS